MNTNTITEKEAFDIAKEAYVYGYPLVLMNITKKFLLKKVHINKFLHMKKFPNYKFKGIVRPNVDTLYSTAWLDLSNGPIILSVPDTHDRYYLMEILDAWTNVFSSIGKRTTGTQAKEFAIVGPDWKGQLPENVTKIQSPTNDVWILGRTQTNGKDDYDFVHKIQEGYKLHELSPTHTVHTWSIANLIPMFRSPAAQVERMNAKTFFTYLAQDLKKNPGQKEDSQILENLKKIGIENNKNFNPNKLPKEVINGLNAGIKAARKEIAQALKTVGKDVNGWKISMDIGNYGTNYLLRAVTALIGIGANIPEDAVYPTTYIDNSRDKLSGKNKYILHFDEDDIPPVNAFWSVTMYNSDSYLVKNSINRYALGDRDNLQFNKDGSLDIYIQHDAPDKDHISNWLPAPVDNFNLTLRLYWPKESVLNDTWNPRAIRLTS